jgi:hypothetical protein
MKKLTNFLIIDALLMLTSCNLLHSTPQFELEQLSEDVLTSKSGRGISITVLPIDEPKK